MDANHFDCLAKAVSSVGTRRRLLGVLAALPLTGTLAAVLGDETAAKGRRQRRTQRRQTHHDRAQDQRHKRAKHQAEQERRKDAKSEACIPTGNKCPSKKPRGKSAKRLGCNRCCQGVAVGTGRGKRVCGCVPVGASCASGGTAACCSGVCDGSTCQRGDPPSPPPPPCTTHGECGPDALCLDDGSCQSCTVTCAAGETPEDCGLALQAALDDADEGGSVYACPGLYQPDGVNGFTIDLSLTLIGAGQGDDPQVDTLLDADGGGTVMSVLSEAEEVVTLRHLRFTGGDSGSGGGIVHAGGPLIVSDCTVIDNTAINGGGIFNAFGSTLELTRCTVRDNHAVNPGGVNIGGGIFNGGILTVTDCLIEVNDADEDGGGIYNNGGATTLAGATEVRDNEAADVGGGFYISNGTLEIGPDCRVTLNTADPGQGGGIFANDPDDVTLANVDIVTDNTGGNCEPEGQIDNCVG